MSDDEQQSEVVGPRATPAGWVPAFPGQRPPFTSDHPAIAQPGNLRGLHHGFYSERVLAPVAKQIIDEILAVPANAYLREAQWRPALVAYGRAEAQVLNLLAYIDKLGQAVDEDAAPGAGGVGDLGEDRVRAAYLLLHRAEASALSGRTRLGLDPLSRARLGRDVAAAQVDVAELLARMAEAAGGQSSSSGDDR